MHRRIVILIMALGLIPMFSWINHTNHDKVSVFDFEYKTPTKIVTLRDTMVIMLEYVEQNEGISSLPSVKKEVIKSASVSKERVLKLKADIKASKFMKLVESHYGSADMERNYPYTIHVRIDLYKKAVTYRSSPSVPPAPKEFLRTEKLINDFLAEITNWK
jgi:hypothetical protein